MPHATHFEEAGLTASSPGRQLSSSIAKALASNPAAPLTMAKGGPLFDIAASDAELLTALRLFSELQEKRHQAGYDHDARYEKLTLLDACRNADTARDKLRSASNESKEALFTLLTVRRSDFRTR